MVYCESTEDAISCFILYAGFQSCGFEDVFYDGEWTTWKKLGITEEQLREELHPAKLLFSQKLPYGLHKELTIHAYDKELDEVLFSRDGTDTSSAMKDARQDFYFETGLEHKGCGCGDYKCVVDIYRDIWRYKKGQMSPSDF